MSLPLIEVLLDGKEMTPAVAGALKSVKAEIYIDQFSRDSRSSSAKSPDARLILTTDARKVTNGKLGRLIAHFDRDPCATLVLADVAGDTIDPVPAMQGRAIGFAAAMDRRALVGRLSAMCDMRRPMDRLRRRLDLLEQRDTMRAAEERRVGAELDLAARLQMDLLPRSLPKVAGLRTRVVFRPAETVSGDLYNIARLDESHVAFSLIDATGHGVSAALLSVYLHRLLCGWESTETGRRILQPDEVLRRINTEIIERNLHDCHFVCGLHAVYDEEARTLRWARGGMPYPLVARRGEPFRPIKSSGPVMGVMADGVFDVIEIALEPGDRVLFATDGVETLRLDHRGSNDGPLGAALDLHRDATIDEMLDGIERSIVVAANEGRTEDDVTVIGITVE